MKKKNIVDNKQFECSKHSIDYRLLCEECEKKYKKFSKFLQGTLLKGL